MKDIDIKCEIQYWREQCEVLQKDVRILRQELFFKDFFSNDKYEKFKEWVIKNHSDVWIAKGIFDAFEKDYNPYNINGDDGRMSEKNIHENCENYNLRKDYCLKFFTDEVSKKYPHCQEYSKFNDEELQRKWSN